ncbi:UDP-rhamnose/UDP-galactose transporter 1 [Orobanche minor]
MEGEKKLTAAVSDVGAWAMNVISSVGIIMANKQLLSTHGYAFGFATTLTGFHFAITAIVGIVSNATGFSASKHIPLWELLWFSIVANMSITGMNLSLMLNSVGFYQSPPKILNNHKDVVHTSQDIVAYTGQVYEMSSTNMKFRFKEDYCVIGCLEAPLFSQISKLSMIPVVCVMEWILHSKQYTNEVKLSVVVVVIGVGVCTVTDVKVNAKGFLCACVAVFSTSLQQISIGALQKKYSIGSFELLSKTAPVQAGSLLVLGPIIDYYISGNLILDYKFTSGAMLFILLSCCLAVFCNVSQYLCIGRFSAVSFQVLGHMKTVCVLTLGWLLFDSELTFKNVMGMGIAVIGMVIYSWAVEVEKHAHNTTNKKIATPRAKNSLTEEEIRLLKEGVMETNPVRDIELGYSKFVPHSDSQAPES